jgi:hypothetical protein
VVSGRGGKRYPCATAPVTGRLTFDSLGKCTQQQPLGDWASRINTLLRPYQKLKRWLQDESAANLLLIQLGKSFPQ